LVTQLQERVLAEGRQLRATGGEYQGPELELTLASGTVYPVKGRVRFANNQVDVKTGTVRVVGEFENPQGLLAPGMFVRVRALLSTEKNALVVPQRAVAELQGRKLIAIVGADNKVNIRPITTGETFGEMWVVSGPLQPGDKVVAEGIQKVRDGLTVNPVPFNPAATGKPAAEKPAAAPAAEK
jgi:membrane fusion protein, multidrug efflux system